MTAATRPDHRVADRPGDLSELYDTDVIAWAYRQSALLRAGRFAELDIEHIADEIEDVAKIFAAVRSRTLRSQGFKPWLPQARMA